MVTFPSPLEVLNAVAGLSRHGEHRALAYGPDARHWLDIYTPAGAKAAAGRPVVVFFYGGGWTEGDRHLYRFVGAALARRGFVTVIPDYRVYPQVRFPAFLEDAARAVRWTRTEVSAFGGDPARMVLMGHSAGAHLAAMLSLDRQWLGAHGLVPARDLRGLVGLAGPYDFLPLRTKVLQTIFGPESLWPLSQPIRFVDGRAPPALLVSGQRDTAVDPGNSVRLADRILAAGGEAQVQLYPRLDHATLLGAFSPLLRPLAPVARDVARFISQQTLERAPAPVLVPAQEGHL